MSAAEFSRSVAISRLPARPVELVADEEERRKLAGRFGLPSIARFEAMLTLVPEGTTVDATGRLSAGFSQNCAVAGEPFDTALDVPLTLRFVPALAAIGEEEEHEFAPDDPDEIEYDGATLDLGEAVAQSFGLALDPYATGPDADTARRAAGLDGAGAGGAFAALASLKRKD